MYIIVMILHLYCIFFRVWSCLVYYSLQIFVVTIMIFIVIAIMTSCYCYWLLWLLYIHCHFMFCCCHYIWHFYYLLYILISKCKSYVMQHMHVHYIILRDNTPKWLYLQFFPSFGGPKRKIMSELTKNSFKLQAFRVNKASRRK